MINLEDSPLISTMKHYYYPKRLNNPLAIYIPPASTNIKTSAENVIITGDLNAKHTQL